MSETRVFPIGNCPHDVQRQVLGENPDLTVVFFSFPEGGKGDLYNHAHTHRRRMSRAGASLSL